MAGKLSPIAQTRMALLEGFMPKVARIHNLVEQFAVAKVGQDNLTHSIKRAADQTKMGLMGVGLDTMSQQCGAIVMAASRAGNQGAKARLLRELVGQLRFQLDLEVRGVLREDQELKDKEKAKSAD